ncbi:MAG: tetratricopeptide repeat protein [Candidatus Hydrogenedentes bacterium]|nr:tetratricopeptide repeat protein [Candidatus Hydrogenedentota bacterium]
MTTFVSENSIPCLSDFVAGNLGIYFPPPRWSELQRSVERATQALGFPDVEACVNWLLTPPLNGERMAVLTEYLTVGETYFFRDPPLFQALEGEILPALIQARRARGGRPCLRVWSAGCCTGEEPYTLAMVLKRLLPDLDGWDLLLSGTDINLQFLEKARQGIYGAWSFRNVPPYIQERYFSLTLDKRWQLNPALRQMVSFSCLNLAADPYPAAGNNTSEIDLLLCRNVLMYFDAGTAAMALTRFHAALAEDGLLVVSPPEFGMVPGDRFRMIQYGDCLVYRKISKACSPRPAPPNPYESVPVVSAQPTLSGTGGRVAGTPGKTPSARRLAPRGAPPLAPLPPRDGCAALAEMEAAYSRKEYALVRELGGRALEQGPDNGEVLRLLVRCHANEGRLEEALSLCDRAIARDRVNAAGHFLRGMLLLEGGALPEAQASFRNACFLAPDFVLAHFISGDLARRLGRIVVARRHWRNALRLLSECPSEAPVPESEGLSAGRLREMLETLLSRGAPP